MKFIYPAVFKKKTDGGYAAYFPDLESAKHPVRHWMMPSTTQMKLPEPGSR